MQPEQRWVTPMARAMSSLCLALISPSAMDALASWPKPCMASGWDWRKGPSWVLMFWIRPAWSKVLMVQFSVQKTRQCRMRSSNLLALGAIVLWASLAALGVRLSHLPPFWLTGVALLLGSVMALPLMRLDFAKWRIPLPTLTLGVYGLFGFHFLLFIALRHAPPVEANLVNYLWPLGMVVLAPVLLPGTALRPLHVVAALLGFAGAAVAILGARGTGGATGFAWGFVPALGSAFIWASYSLWTKRVPAFPTSAIGAFGLVSGLLALLCH